MSELYEHPKNFGACVLLEGLSGGWIFLEITTFGNQMASLEGKEQEKFLTRMFICKICG